MQFRRGVLVGNRSRKVLKLECRGDRRRVGSGLEQVALMYQPDMVGDERGSAKGHHGDGDGSERRRASARLAQETVRGHGLPSRLFFEPGRSRFGSRCRAMPNRTTWGSSFLSRRFHACRKPGSCTPAAGCADGLDPSSGRMRPPRAPIRNPGLNPRSAPGGPQSDRPYTYPRILWWPIREVRALDSRIGHVAGRASRVGPTVAFDEARQTLLTASDHDGRARFPPRPKRLCGMKVRRSLGLLQALPAGSSGAMR